MENNENPIGIIKYNFALGILNMMLKKNLITVAQFDELDKSNKAKYLN